MTDRLTALAKLVADVPIRNLPRLLEPDGSGFAPLPGCVHCGMAAPEHGPSCNRPRTIGEALALYCEPGRDFALAASRESRMAPVVEAAIAWQEDPANLWECPFEWLRPH